MKILQVNAVYGMGSTGNIVRDISQQLLAQGHQSVVLWATGCRPDDSQVELIRVGNTLDHKLHALLRRLDAGQGMHSKAATKKACKKILEISPDVVHLHNLHSNYIHIPTLLKFLGKQKIPTLITLHDCWFLTGYCPHYIYEGDCQNWQSGCKDCPAVCPRLQKRVQSIFEQRQTLFGKMSHLAVNGVSKWTTDAAKASVLKSADPITCIYNWIDTALFKPTDAVERVKQKYGIANDRKILLGVSQSWSATKGLDAFLALADALADTADVVLVGKDEGVPQKENLHCIGFTSDVRELIDLYSAADVLVNASNAETFGLVTVEAMACGTPVVAYNNSGSAELVTDTYGALVEDGNQEALLAGVKDVLAKEKSEYSAVCRAYVCENFEKMRQTDAYIELYRQISSSESGTPLAKKTENN